MKERRKNVRKNRFFYSGLGKFMFNACLFPFWTYSMVDHEALNADDYFFYICIFLKQKCYSYFVDMATLIGERKRLTL